MRHLRNLGSQFSISLPPDEEGLIGRECPLRECEGYFKPCLSGCHTHTLPVVFGASVCTWGDHGNGRVFAG